MDEELLDFLRNTTYLVQSVLVDVAQDDILDDVEGSVIPLNSLYEGFARAGG